MAEALPFLKMHGLGNDFVVIDARQNRFVPTEKFLRAIANRRRGVGCDQIILLKELLSAQADIYQDMYNADGSIVRACGNATRCVASLMFQEMGRKKCVIETVAGLLGTWQESPDLIAVDFGKPKLQWQEIPLAHNIDTLNVTVSASDVGQGCCVNMGNPHAVFFVPDAEAVDLGNVGPRLEHDLVFPDRCNIEFAQILAPDLIRMRVWERGAGITEACGSGACATLVAAVRRGLSARRATLILDGGELVIEWRDDGHVVMIGTASVSYRGAIAADFGHD